MPAMLLSLLGSKTTWIVIAVVAALAYVGIQQWRISSLKDDLRVETENAATARSAAEANADAVRRLSAEIERVNAVAAQREVAIVKARREIDGLKRSIADAKGTDRDAPAAGVWSDVFVGLRGDQGSEQD